MGDVVGSIASSAIEFLLQNLISLCKEEIILIWNFKEDLDELIKSLEMIRDFLEDAEKEQVTRQAVKRWLINLEAVAFDADNILDELNYEVHRRKMKPENKLMEKVRALFSTRKMGLEIKSINQKLKSINKEATDFGLQRQFRDHVPGVGGSSLTLAERETASNPDQFVVGRENYVSSIVEILTHNEQEVFSVLPIFGMGGLGKTTLAKLVFHDKKIEAHFEKRIWVYVSENFDQMTLLKKILESLTESSKDEFNSKDALLRKLRENLETKKYLLVLDDVWTEETKKWDDFVDTLSSITSTKGNGIIVTTRSDTVASIVGTIRIEKLKGLSDDDCWSIIKEKTFGEKCFVPLEFEAIGRKIAHKCQGLPLAAKVMGGLLLREKSKGKWYSIEKDELSNLGEDGNTMRKILKLSFDNLPSQSLKKCFAFCAILPKGYEIEKSMLIHLWMTEGFLQSDDMETLGDKYFDLLLHNSLLQVGLRNFDGRINHYTMHDLVCDLAFSVLNEYGPVRCIYLKSITDIPKEKAGNVRWLIFDGEISDDDMLSEFKHLRGLVLIGRDNKQLPKIEHLIHLRYLDILRTSIECSTKLIHNLYLLQAFRANVAHEELLEVLNKLINLRHVEVTVEYHLECPSTYLECVQLLCLGCLRLLCIQKQTSAMRRLPNLKTLYIRERENIFGIYSSSPLENLLANTTSLTKLQFEDLEGLECLPDMFFHNNQNLAYLIISGSVDLTHMPPRFGVSLREVEMIRCLKLEGLPEIPHCLDKLILRSCRKIKSIPYNPSSDLPSLRELEITYCDGLTELPIELLESSSSSLESLCLWGLESVTNMGMVIACLQKMPRLTSLEVDLRNLATDDLSIKIVGSFDSLHELRISCGMGIWQRLEDLLQQLNALRKLALEESEMEAVPEWLGKLPSLRELILSSCRKLRSLPSKEALQHLTRLTVYGCRLLKLGRDDDNSEWHKVSHIPLVHQD